jgi:hypothetical protein
MSPCRLPDAASDRRTSIVQQPSLVVSINGSKWLRQSSKVDFLALAVDDRERADSLARTVCAQPEREPRIRRCHLTAGLLQGVANS